MTTALSFPFRIDGYGRVASTKDPYRIWADRVRIALMTSYRERVMRPEYGCGLVGQTMENIEETPEVTYSEISRTFSEYLPSLTLVDVVKVSETPELGEVSLEVIYEVPDVKIDPVSQVVNLRIN